MNDILLSIRQFLTRLASSASVQENSINRLFNEFLVMAAIILVLVLGIVIIGGYRYYHRKWEGEPDQTSGNTVLEITWTVVPFLALVFFFFLTLQTMKSIDRPVSENQKPDIVIIAHQWWWEFRYPGSGVITANELHIPAGRNMLMQVGSADVIHDWWVPELGRKIDAIPGRMNYSWIDASKPGTYLGTCSEYCGTQHAWMRIRVIAEPPEKFFSWILDQKKNGTMPWDPVTREGALLFQQKTCSGCHAIRGTPASSHIAPDLTHVASRETLLSGMVKNTVPELTRWLKNPQKVKEGARMPNFMLDDHDLKCLTAYINSLR